MKQRITVLSELLKPLGDPLRLNLLSYLADGKEHCVCKMAESLSEPEFNISRKLAPLRKLGLICARREGTWMHYHLCTDQCRLLVESLGKVLGIRAGLLQNSPLSTLKLSTSSSGISCNPKSKSSCCAPETPVAAKSLKAGHVPSKATKSKSGRQGSKPTD